jgi:hypothetical protein
MIRIQTYEPGQKLADAYVTAGMIGQTQILSIWRYEVKAFDVWGFDPRRNPLKKLCDFYPVSNWDLTKTTPPPAESDEDIIEAAEASLVHSLAMEKDLFFKDLFLFVEKTSDLITAVYYGKDWSDFFYDPSFSDDDGFILARDHVRAFRCDRRIASLAETGQRLNDIPDALLIDEYQFSDELVPYFFKNPERHRKVKNET